MSKEKKLPTIAELTEDKQLAESTDKFNYLINQNPPEKWVKEHPIIDEHLYLPIDKVELMLKRLFKEYRVEIKETKMMMNAVVCTVRVHYFHPVRNEWSWQDGVGADELQTKKGTGSLKNDMSNVQRGAIPMSAPIAETIAIKDACHKIGRIFGADLNRKDLKPYTIDEDLADKTELESEEDWEMLKESVRLGKMSPHKAIDLYKLNPNQMVELQEIEVKPKD